jgi:hypothetical protein
MTRAELAKLLSSFLPDKAAPATPLFKDIKGHWARSAIEQLADEGLMVGFEDNSFRPDDVLTRAQIVTVLCRLLGRAASANEGNAESSFTDLHDTH